MMKMGSLCVFLLVACGGSAPAPTAPEPVAAEPIADTRPLPDPDPDLQPVPRVLDKVPSVGEFATPVETPALPPPPVPPPLTAVAELLAIDGGAVIGAITFERHGAEVAMDGSFAGLPPGPHAIYIHAGGDCGRKGKNAGKHLDPTGARHGPPASSVRHAGDLGDLIVDAAGQATFAMTTDSVTMEAGRADSVLDRAIVVHARKDDKNGNAGAAIACGVIQLRP